MSKYTLLDQVAVRFPLRSCVKSNHPTDPIYGRVIGWTLYADMVAVNAICIPGHHPMHLIPDAIRIIQPSDMPDYTRPTAG